MREIHWRAALVAVALAALVAGRATALPYTLDANLLAPGYQGIDDFQLGSALVRISPVTDWSGALVNDDLANGSLLLDPFSQDWFLFELNVLEGTVTEVSINNLLRWAVGIGHIYRDGDAIGPTGGALDPQPDATPEWFFEGLGSGDESMRLVAAYDAGSLPGPGIPFLFAPGAVSFMLNDGNILQSRIATAVPIPSSNVNIVPEPRSAILFGLGVAALAWIGRPRPSA